MVPGFAFATLAIVLVSKVGAAPEAAITAKFDEVQRELQAGWAAWLGKKRDAETAEEKQREHGERILLVCTFGARGA